MSGASQDSAQGAATDGRERPVETLRLRGEGEGLVARPPNGDTEASPQPVHAELVGLEEGAEPHPSLCTSSGTQKERATVDPADQLRVRQAQGERGWGELSASPSSPPHAPTPSLAACIEALPADDAFPPQTKFDRASQAKFLEHIATTGSARGAARVACVSHQTVYRMRRGNGVFRRAWDAALLVAKAHSVAVLADRAIDGFTEDVWFHGEVVGQRRRFDTRLLLAHLGRLDRLEDNADAAALADDFDDVLARIRDGADLPPPMENRIEDSIEKPAEPVSQPEPAQAAPARTTPPVTPAALSSGPCNKRSMSPAEAVSDAPADTASEPGSTATEPPCDCPGIALGPSGDAAHFEMTPQGRRPVLNVDGSGPCCDRPRWPDCKDCVHYPPVSRLLNRMEDARPAHAPPLEQLGEYDEVEACQIDAFEAGEADWWRFGEDFVLYREDEWGEWVPEREEARAEGEPVPA